MKLKKPFKKPTFLPFLLFVLLSLTREANARVGIGTTTPVASSILDLISTTKGLLSRNHPFKGLLWDF